MSTQVRLGGVGGASAHQAYIPPRRIDQAPRYKGFTPRSFCYAAAALTLIAFATVFLPQFIPVLSWDVTLPIVAPIALLTSIWPRKIRDRQWEEGELLAIALRRFRTRGRRFST